VLQKILLTRTNHGSVVGNRLSHSKHTLSPYKSVGESGRTSGENTATFHNRPMIRASVKLFELGVHTPGGLFLGVWYARGIDFRHFSYAKPSDFRHNFWPTRSDEDV